MPSRPTGSAKRASSDKTWSVEMARLFRQGEFSQAARIFDTQAGSRPSYQSILQRARIYVKRDYASALRFLIDHPADKEDFAHEASRQMLLGMAYGRIGDHDLAVEHFSGAQRLATRAKARELQIEIAYWRGRGFVLQGDLDKAEAEIRNVGKSQSLMANIWRLDLQSLIHGRHQRYRAQADTLIALININHCYEEAPDFHAWATHTLAILAREIDIPEARSVIESQLSREWADYFRENRFQTEKALAWVCALQGDYFNAFRYLKAATATAPDDAWKTMVLLDRAYLAKCTGEMLWSRQELAEAEESAASVDWRTKDGEERLAMLLFAELFSTLDRGKSAYYLAQFGKAESLSNPLLNFASNDDRLRAIAGYVHGVVDLALEHRKQGLQSLRKSFAIFDRIGYDWRAGRSALRIYECNHDSAMLTNAREKLRHYAASWLGRELSKSTKTSVRLTPMQEKIFRELCQGLSTSAIAARLGRSEFTIRNHLKLVFGAFGVNSRTELLAEASRRGLMP